MKQNSINISSRINRLCNQIAAEKKKTILALGLIALMALMWVRLFTGKKPSAAEATVTVQKADSIKQTKSQPKISFIELPQIPGRNDVIIRDFFDSNDWRGFITEAKFSIDGQKIDAMQRSINLRSRLIQAGLKLEAIELGENPRAFISDKLLSIGEKLILKDETDTYECEVAQIKENKVLIRCGELEVELKLTPEG
jgi:hypothetical protein